eukprot:SAG22_NODE_6587_length_835_cov_1.046196_1_plen_206_part_00
MEVWCGPTHGVFVIVFRSFVNNTCLHWFGDVYSYGQYWQPSAAAEQRRLQATGRVPPPFVHTKCDQSLITRSAWPSANNTIMAVAQPRVRCGDKRWTMAEWQALGFDADSKIVRLPNATTWSAEVVNTIMTRVRSTLRMKLDDVRALRAPALRAPALHALLLAALPLGAAVAPAGALPQKPQKKIDWFTEHKVTAANQFIAKFAQ